MNRTKDPTMDLLRGAAAQFSGIADIPGLLKSANAGEAEDKLLSLQAQIGERLVALAHAMDNAKASAADLATRVGADQAITDSVTQLIQGVSLDEARSLALRVCVGCIEGAKVPRQEEMTLDSTGSAVTRSVSNSERQSDMVEVDRRCSQDRVYAAGVAISPLDKKLRNRQDPFFQGIALDLLDKHFGEYFRRFPPKNK